VEQLELSFVVYRTSTRADVRNISFELAGFRNRTAMKR